MISRRLWRSLSSGQPQEFNSQFLYPSAQRFCQVSLTKRFASLLLGSFCSIFMIQSLAERAFAGSHLGLIKQESLHKSDGSTVVSDTQYPAFGLQALTLFKSDAYRSVLRADLMAAGSASALNNRGIDLMNQGLYTEATALFDQVLRLNPQYAPAYNNRAMVHLLMGDPAAAIQDYTASLSISTDKADIYVNRGLAYASQEQMDKAISDYTQAILIDPYSAEAYHGRGGAYLSLNQRAAARSDFQHAAALYLQQGNQQSYSELQEFMKQF